MHPLLNIAISAARQAGDIILRNAEQVHKLKITEKKLNDFCSEVDIQAEQVIINTINKNYPQHGIVAEESGNFNKNSDFVWIIDPLDGTKNYLHEFPFYAVSIAISHKNKIEHGVIYDPLRHECFTASRGQGARLNNQRIRVSTVSQLNTSLISLNLHANNPNAANKRKKIYENFACTTGGLRSTGSATLDLAYVASKRIDGCITQEMKPWDIAAGTLLIQEAGGFVSDIDGSDNYLSSGNILAANPKIHKQMLQTINNLNSTSS